MLVSSHLYDGVRHFPLDGVLYQPASCYELGKADPEFVKKPELALRLIDQCNERGNPPSAVLVDAGYGNNTPFLKQLEERQLTYIGAIAKNRRVYYQGSSEGTEAKYRLEELAQQLSAEHFMPVELALEKPRTVWVALVQLRLPKLQQRHWVAIQLNAATFAEATDVDYFITNAPNEQVTAPG